MAGVLLGGFYAAVSLGIAVTFGLLDVVNIAHPVFVILGAYTAFTLNSAWGLDPLLAGVLFVPVFFGIGVAVYQVYYVSFEKKGESPLRGLVFFFGLLFIIEVALMLKFGVDYRMIEAPYVGESIHLGPVGIAFRLLVPCLVGVLMTLGLYLFLGKTFYRAGHHGRGPGQLGPAARGSRSHPDQDPRLRSGDRHRQRGRGAAHPDLAGRALHRPRLHRPRLRHHRARGPREHRGNTGGGDDPRAWPRA